MAVDAGFRTFCFWRVVTPGVVTGRKIKHIARTVCNAVAASFTPLLYDVNDAAGYLDVFGIERGSPILH
jgi:hypothetical protein